MRRPLLLEKKRKHLKALLVLDIGTEAVKALVIKVRGERVTVLGAASQDFDRFAVFDTREFETEVLRRAIFGAIEGARRGVEEEINSLIIGLPPNVLKARVSFGRLQRKDRKKSIDEEEKKDILKKLVASAKEKVSLEFGKRTGVLPHELVFLQSKVLETRIDGYDVPSLSGFKGKDIELRILVTFLPDYYFNNFLKVIQPLSLPISKISHPVESLSNLFFGDKDLEANFVDIGGDLTQFFIVKKGKLEEIGEFEGGGNTFSQTISLRLGVPWQMAKSLKERYSKGLLSEGARRRIEEMVLGEAKDWLLKLKKGLGEGNFRYGTLFLFGGASVLPEIKEVLEETYQEAFLGSRAWQVKLVFPKDLPNLEGRVEEINTPQNVPVLLLCYHAL